MEPRAKVAIARFGADEDWQLIRLLVESFQADVRLATAATPAEIAATLSEPPETEFLVLTGHGDERGFILDELVPELAEVQPFNGRLTPALVEAHGSLAGRVVIACACQSGAPRMGRAFLAAGATAYIAPDGYPFGEDVIVFISVLFHGLLALGLKLDEAVRRARAAGRSSELFQLYSTPAGSSASRKTSPCWR